MKTLIVIPARLASTRLPEKMLLKQSGKTLIEHTYRQAAGAGKADRVLVATDHPRIVAAVEAFGGEVMMTDPNHASGSERCAEVAAALPEFDLICNVQGDEPEIEASAIDGAIEKLVTTIALGQDPQMATLATPIREAALLHDPSCVKVTFDHQGRALYFSRSLIPHPRDFAEEMLTAQPPFFFQHVGLYVYRREFLQGWSRLPSSGLEKVERLEQLRVLEAGFQIMVEVIEHSRPGIDTLADYRAFVSRQTKC